jgi:RND family efflux transporter MFP subunit
VRCRNQQVFGLEFTSTRSQTDVSGGILRAILISLIVATAAWAGDGSLSAPAPLKLVKARPSVSIARDEVTGQLMPSKLGPLGFEVGGRLAQTRAQKGEQVKAGQLLGQLDPEIADAQVSQAEAAVAAAEAQATIATDVAARNEKLQGEGSVSDVQSKSAAAQAKQAQAQLLAAKAQLQQAKAARKKHDLHAPFGGTVVDAPDQIGGMVGPGTPVYIVMQLDPLVLKATIPESARQSVKVGTKVKVSAISSAAFTTEAVVKLIIPSADPATHRVPVEISVPNSDGRFVANTLARAVLPLGDAHAALAIPATALGTTGGEHVFVVTAAGALRKVPVNVLERGAKEVIVAAPELLDEVVDYPTSALVEGTRVSVVH